MRSFEKNLLRAFVFAALTVLSSQSFALQITAYPDSVKFTSEVGAATTAAVFVSDGRDSSQFPHTPLTDAYVWITGSSDYSLGSDSVISFFGATLVIVDYTASSLTPSSAVLHIQGDSNEVDVALTGTPPNHINLSFEGDQDFGTLYPGVSKCDSVTLYNPNSFSITVTSLTIASQNAGCQLNNNPTVPFTMTGYQRINFDACLTCKADSGRDTASIRATITAGYTYPNGSDVAYDNIGGYVLPVPPLDSTCLSYPSLYLGDCNIGNTIDAENSVTNTTSSDVTIDSAVFIDGSVSDFGITASEFPMTLRAGATGYFHLSFTAPSDADQGELYSAGIDFYSTGTSGAGTPCSPMAETVSGTATIPIVDSITLDAPPDGDSTLTISTSLAKSRYLILIKNDTTVSIDPEMLQITDSGSDAYFNTPGNESVTFSDSEWIAPGVITYYDPIVMTLDVLDTGTYNIDMALTYQVQGTKGKMEITSMPVSNYHIVAHYVPSTPPASVNQPSQTSMDFSIMPNPAHGDVTISLPTSVTSTIEIYDVLGNLMMRQQGNGSFVWNGATSTGDMVPNGAYIVRVSTTGSGGVVSTSSKQLMIMR
jgi:hypothetical protein